MEYEEKKENTSEEIEAPPPKKLKMSAKGGHDRSFQKRMEIAILASRGVKPDEFVKAVGCNFDMGIRWSDRSEEVMQTGSVQSKTQGQSRTSTYFCNTFGKEKTLQAAQGINTEKVGEKIDSQS